MTKKKLIAKIETRIEEVNKLSAESGPKTTDLDIMYSGISKGLNEALVEVRQLGGLPPKRAKPITDTEQDVMEPIKEKQKRFGNPS